jgi:hypothetical protein
MASFDPNRPYESSTITSEVLEVRDKMLRGERLSWEEVASWARSGNVELMGAAFQALTSIADNIDGDIDGVEAERFIVTYLILVIEGRGGTADVFQMQPYLAAHEIARLYKNWRGQALPPEDTLKYVRNELFRLYVSGDEKQRRRIVDGAIEHIFEETSCRTDFGDWKDSPIAAKAIEEAMEWARDRPAES